jgi:hypothetical protein
MAGAPPVVAALSEGNGRVGGAVRSLGGKPPIGMRRASLSQVALALCLFVLTAPKPHRTKVFYQTTRCNCPRLTRTTVKPSVLDSRSVSDILILIVQSVTSRF